MDVTLATPKQHSMLGMRLDYISPEGAVEVLAERAAGGGGGYAVIADVHECMVCHDNADHRRIVNNALVVLSDSTILQRARALRHGVPGIPTVRGGDIMLQLCAEAARRGIPVAFIGGRTDAALEALTEAVAARCPGIRIAYAWSPPFRDLTGTETTAMVRAINASGAGIVFVGLGCPKQERFMARHEHEIDAVMIGVGAAFDFVAGEVKPSPAWVHRAGLEWLYRIWSEPRRLLRRYMTTAPRFVALMTLDYVRGR